MRRSVGLGIVGCLLAVLLAGCGDEQQDLGSGTDTPATPGALAAVAVSHLPDDPDTIESLADTYWRLDGPRTIGADLRFDPGEGDDGDLVRVSVGPAGQVPRCSFPDRCALEQSPAGTWQVSWAEVAPEEDPGFVAVALYTDDDVRRILLAGPTITGDPRTSDLDLVGSVATMKEIVGDPAFALTTTRAAVDAGKDLEDWDGRDVPVAGPAPLVDWEPRALAALVYGRLPASYSFGPSTITEPSGPAGEGTGIRFSAYGPKIDLLLVEGVPAGSTRCPAGYECATEDGVTYGWAGRTALVFRERDGFVVRVYVNKLGRDVSGVADFARDEILGPLVALTADADLGLRMPADWAEFADEVDWSE